MAESYLKKRKRGWYFVLEIPALFRSTSGDYAGVEMLLLVRSVDLATFSDVRIQF